MAEDFNIQIKVDPNNATSTIGAVKSELAALEAKGTAAGPAVSTALKDVATASDQVATKSVGASRGLAEATSSALRLEGGMTQLLGAYGEYGKALDLVSAKGIIETGMLAGLAAEVVHMNDEYIELQHTAVRLVDNFDDVNSTIVQQLSLSQQLHQGLAQTMELSASVKEYTEGANFSAKERNELTKEFSELTQLSGRSATAASSNFERLAFAFQNGQAGGRGVMDVLRDMPSLMGLLKEHFHATQGEITIMAQKGQIDMRTLYNVIHEGADQTDQKFQHMAESSGMSWQHFKDEVTVAVGEIGQGLDYLKSKADSANNSWGSFLNGFTGLEDEVHMMAGDLKTAADYAALFAKAAENIRGAAKADAVASLRDNIHGLGDEFGKVSDRVMADLQKGGIKALIADADKAAGKTHEHVQALSDLDKLLKEIKGPQEDLDKALANTEILFDTNKISASEYADETERLTEKIRALNEENAKLGLAPYLRNYGDSLRAIGSTAFGGLKNIGTGIDTSASGAGAALGGAFEGKNHDAEDFLKRGKEELAAYDAQVKSTAQSVQGLMDPVFKNLEQAVLTGKFSWRSLGETIIQTLEQVLIKTLEVKAAMALAGALTPGVSTPAASVDSFLSAVGAQATGGVMTIPHAANGYSGVFGGQGGTDSRLFMARVTPGEHVAIRTPQQVAAERQQGTPGPTMIVNKLDPRDLMDLLESPEAGRKVINHIRLNPNAVKSALR